MIKQCQSCSIKIQFNKYNLIIPCFSYQNKNSNQYLESKVFNFETKNT